MKDTRISALRSAFRPALGLAFVLSTAASHAEILYDQMTNFASSIITSSWLPPDGFDGDTYSYDNFLLSGDATINEVWWVGGGGTISGLTVRFYTGLAAAPDYQPTITALPESETSADYLKGYRFTGNGNQTAIPGSSLYQYHVVLPTTLSLPGNTVYWIKIEGDSVGYPFWGVALATHGRDSRHITYFTGGPYFLPQSGSEAFQLRGTFSTASVSGQVVLQDLTGSAAGRSCDITIYKDGVAADTQSVTLGANGAFSLQTIVRGAVTIQAKSTHWLSKSTPTTLNLTGSGLTGVNFSLANGDVDRDNEVSLADYGLLAAAFGSASGDGNWNPEADLDGDGEVTLSDYSTLSRNFGQAGD